ncbi:MAG: hypothetical protein IBX47_06335 [Desulfuromonadales bacterium]|nr:hypothetical protein [Desulfuromonadales bacterium]
MNISERYRSLVEDINAFITSQQQLSETDADPARKRALKSVAKGYRVIDELRESVGEIPRIRLEEELTPVLMKAHNALDQGRLEYIDTEEDDLADSVWELQQTIYRLLNAL